MSYNGRVRAKRSLGQNFLVSSKVAEEIAAACREAAAGACSVLEIGPGKGALTSHLSRLGLPLVLVEKDDRLAAEAAARFPGSEVINADILEIDAGVLLRRDYSRPWLVAGNLPYNVGTRVARLFLRFPSESAALLFMLQDEVVQKLRAVEGEEGYGPLAVLCRTWWKPERLLRVSPGAFRPAPKVTSAVIRLVPVQSPPLGVECFDEFAPFMEACFAAPRKLLAANLALVAGEKNAALRLMGVCGLDQRLRPAEASPGSYAKLFLAVRAVQTIG